jgi:hypothetical protein
VTVSSLDARSRARLAEKMIPVAADFACALRDEDAAMLGQRLDPMTRQDLYALVTVLGAMVDVEQPVGDLLAWVTFGDGACPDLPVYRSPSAAAERRLEYARLRGQGLSQEEAAGRLHVAVRTVARYETGLRQAEVA